LHHPGARWADRGYPPRATDEIVRFRTDSRGGDNDPRVGPGSTRGVRAARLGDDGQRPHRSNRERVWREDSGNISRKHRFFLRRRPSRAWLMSGRTVSGGTQAPVPARCGTHNRGDGKKDRHNKPFESATVLIWIPSRQVLDPVVPENSEEPERSREQCDRGLQADTSPGRSANLRHGQHPFGGE